MMSFSTHVAVTALALLVLCGGVLYPVHTSITELESSLVTLEQNDSVESTVPQQLAAVQDEIEVVRASFSDRDFSLCPDTPEARNELETALHREIRSSGMSRISMDRQNGFGLGDVPSFAISLVVEGDAFQLHNFLKGLETLTWVTRVLKLEIQPGDEERRIKMQIAVLLENES